MEKKYILDKETAKLKIRRLAFEIAERNYNEHLLFFAGISNSGMVVAKLLAEQVVKISNIHVELLEVTMDKRNPEKVFVDRGIGLNHESVIVIDDVSNSGRTMLYALKPFLDYQPKKIQTLVMVERTHKAVPVQPDYVGLSVATTLEEHIYVELNNDEVTGAYLV